MNKTKMVWIIISAMVTVLAAAWIWNYQLLLLFHGFPLDDAALISSGEDASGQKYRIIGNSSEGKHTALMVVKQGVMGVWTVYEFTNQRQEETGLLTVSTLDARMESREGQSPKTEFETTIVYAGNNAIRPMPDMEGILPDGCSMHCTQNGAWYTVCLNYRWPGNKSKSIRFYDFLKEQKIILGGRR